jgi:hypothetical protein
MVGSAVTINLPLRPGFAVTSTAPTLILKRRENDLMNGFKDGLNGLKPEIMTPSGESLPLWLQRPAGGTPWGEELYHPFVGQHLIPIFFVQCY